MIEISSFDNDFIQIVFEDMKQDEIIFKYITAIMEGLKISENEACALLLNSYLERKNH